MIVDLGTFMIVQKLNDDKIAVYELAKMGTRTDTTKTAVPE